MGIKVRSRDYFWHVPWLGRDANDLTMKTHIDNEHTTPNSGVVDLARIQGAWWGEAVDGYKMVRGEKCYLRRMLEFGTMTGFGSRTQDGIFWGPGSSATWPVVGGSERRPKHVSFKFLCDPGTAVRDGTWACMYQNNWYGTTTNASNTIGILGKNDGDGPEGALWITLATNGDIVRFRRAYSTQSPTDHATKRYDDGKWHSVSITETETGRVQIIIDGVLWLDDFIPVGDNGAAGNGWQMGGYSTLGYAHGGGSRFQGRIRDFQEMVSGPLTYEQTYPTSVLWARVGQDWVPVTGVNARLSMYWMPRDGGGTGTLKVMHNGVWVELWH